MKKNILLPTDFSDNSWSAAIYTLKLFAEIECKFYFIHSLKIKVSTLSNLSNKFLKVMSDDALKELKDLKDIADNCNANANHEFEIILSSEILQDALNHAIKKYQIDFIAMGTEGITSTKDVFFGSNTLRTIKKIKKCPVLIVPDEFDFVKPTQIAFPTDFHHFYGEEILPMKFLAELYNSKIRILHITEDFKLTHLQKYNLERLKTYLNNYTYSFHWIPNYAKKTQEINDFIEELDINILIMINYKHSLIENIIKEPVIKKIGFKPIVPVLVIPCLF